MGRSGTQLCPRQGARARGRRVVGMEDCDLAVGRAVAAVQGFGFAERQARFLVLVLEHSGVCLPPAFAG